MSKKVLIVEDDLGLFNMLQRELGTSFDLIRARSVAEAIGAVEENGPFDCFVVDLSILNLGLEREEKIKYQRREGYAFLKHYLWSGTLEHYEWEGDNLEKVNDLKSKTIICSRHVNDFKIEFRSEIAGLKFVLKNSGVEKKVIDLVKMICQ